MENRHAYLIMAHEEPKLVQILVNLIDDERNDIFIHIDAKRNIEDFRSLTSRHSRITFTERVDVRWGAVSQIKTELVLFKTALHAGKYSYFHLMSGCDLPIKNQDYIHHLFDVKLKGKEFVGIQQFEGYKRNAYYRTHYYHLFENHFQPSGRIAFRCWKIINNLSVDIQKVLGIGRKFPLPVKKGGNWVSITEPFCRYLTDREDEILKIFKYTLCADELFVQTYLFNSPFYNNIYPEGDLRLIDWERGCPYVFTSEDIELIKNSKAVFSRKFSLQDPQLINEVI